MSGDLERRIFLEAIEQEDLEKRAAYLDHACHGEPAIRKSVEALLAAHDEPDNMLDDMLVAGAHLDVEDFHESVHDTEVTSAADHIGMQIGPYRLMEQIGEGGFGLVFVALQESPVERKVALKIVKPGMGSKEVIARFEAERQAVAMMDHPHIARIFDAGVTEDARPYFVMELVRGVPITEFCDSQRYSLSQRLQLYLDVCAAVQHAHQKGVIHRDLKPSNVMVTLHDGKPIVKVIDFGVAKAIGQNLTDKTIYTRFFSMIGTPLYMSPEQAELSSLDVDTRSDIYSLGVMLYELLVGTTPVDQGRLDSAGFDELRRIIREEEPPRPSARVTTLGERVTTIADSRRIESSRLVSTIRGDLDWIVMKSLEKDRSRRYESAADFANDIRLYLRSEPIHARPPSTTYLLTKFARRNRASLVTAALLATTLLVGTFMSLWQMLIAIDEKNEKDLALRKALIAEREARTAREEIQRFAEDLKSANLLIASGQVHADNSRWYSANMDYTQAVETQPSYYLPWVLRGQLYTRLFLWEQGAEDYKAALALGAPTDEPHWWGVPALFKLTGHQQEYEQLRSANLDLLMSEDNGVRWMSARAVLLESEMNSVLANRLVRLCEQWEEKAPGPFPPGQGPHNRFGRRGSGEAPPGSSHEHDGSNDRSGFRAGPRPKPDHVTRRDPSDGEHPEDRPFERPPFDGRQRQGPPLRDEFGRNSFRRPDSQEMPHHIERYVLSLAYLRANAFDECIEILEELNADRGWPSKGIVYAPLAIAYKKAGNDEAAMTALEHSQQSLNEWLQRVTDEPVDRNAVPWFDLTENLLIHRQAEALVTGQVSDDYLLSELYRAAAIRISTDQ